MKCGKFLFHQFVLMPQEKILFVGWSACSKCVIGMKFQAMSALSSSVSWYTPSKTILNIFCNIILCVIIIIFIWEISWSSCTIKNEFFTPQISLYGNNLIKHGEKHIILYYMLTTSLTVSFKRIKNTSKLPPTGRL